MQTTPIEPALVCVRLKGGDHDLTALLPFVTQSKSRASSDYENQFGWSQEKFDRIIFGIYNSISPKRTSIVSRSRSVLSEIVDVTEWGHQVRPRASD
jgi:hypothetical protein